MTLPALINRTNNAENVVRLKKSYEVLNQIAYSLKVENGSIVNTLTNIPMINPVITGDIFANIFAEKMNVAKFCSYSTSSEAEGCWTSGNVNKINGTTLAITWSSSYILTNDGMSYGFGLANTDCTTGTAPDQYCGEILVDINGPRNGPYTLGRDVFRFRLTKDGVSPYPFSDNNCYLGSWGCAKKVLVEGAMNY